LAAGAIQAAARLAPDNSVIDAEVVVEDVKTPLTESALTDGPTQTFNESLKDEERPALVNQEDK
jgi:hypothetical protein